MPYMGLCGLLPVSFSERAAMIVPLVPARVAACVRMFMPRRKALSMCIATPYCWSTWLGRFGVMLPGMPSFE